MIRSVLHRWQGSFLLGAFAWVGGMLGVGGASSLSHAQSIPLTVHPDYRVQQWTVADGLPVNSVRDILRTRDGYLWIATFDGLVRFDGNRFVVFNASNTPGLTSNRIIDLHEGPNDELWLATQNNKVARYTTEGFTTFDEVDGKPLIAQDDRTFYSDGDTLWVKSRTGLFRYHNGHFAAYRPDLFTDRVLGLVRDAAGTLWASVSTSAVYSFVSDGSAQRFPLAEGREGIIYHLFVDRQQRLWAATEYGPQVLEDGSFSALWQTGVTVPAEAQETFYLCEDEQGRLCGHGDHGWWTYEDGNLSYLDDGIRDLASAIYTQRLGPEGQYWRFQGDALYQGTTPILTQARGHVTVFYWDSDGHLWVGGSAGLYLVERNVAIQTVSMAQGLPWNNVYPMVEDSDGEVWVGTWNPSQPPFARTDGTRVTAYRDGPGFPTALYIDRTGTLWMGTDGLYRWQGTRFEAHLPGLDDIFIRNVWAIYEDTQARFWVAEADTLWLGGIDTDPRTWLSFSTGDKLPHGKIYATLETRSGEMFFATNGGGILRLIDPPPSRTMPQQADYAFEALTTEHGLASNQVRDLYEDGQGILWFAMENRGLCRLDRQGQPSMQAGNLLCMDAENGLFDNSLHRILEDDYGRFWFNTNQGIFWVKHADLNAFAAEELGSITSISYTERDGLLNREGNGGVQPAGFKARDGRIWFPSQGGVVIIDPSRVRDPEAPHVVIEAVHAGDDLFTQVTSVVLGAGVRDVDIDYTALEFTRPKDVRFQYRLEGYDEAWNDVGERRTATYTNLAPGTYTFQVRAGLGSVWSEGIASLGIERLPHLWETRWFYILGILGLGVGLVGLYRYRVRQVELRNEALEQAVIERTAQIRQQKEQIEDQAEALREANILKSRFLANISHEFRTPLTLTFGPIEDLLAGRFSVQPEARPHLQRAQRNGKRLLRLINQLLDLARLDAQVLRLKLTQGDLVAFVQQRISAFESLAAKRRIEVHFVAEVDTLVLPFDAEKLEIVILNLLSNAFKFTPAGGQLIVVLRDEDNHVSILVRDTGIGIAAKHLPHLFERFYQADGSATRSHEGSGIGLALCKELVELHGGTITVESTLGRGTTFTVRLPREAVSGASPSSSPAPDEAVEPEPVAIDIAPYLSDEDAVPVQIASEAEHAEDAATVVLVVDDNADMRAYIHSHLAGHFTIEQACDGKEGLERALALVPDLVLSDVMMPEMDGFGLLEALRNDERTSHIPIVLLTAKNDAESKLAGLQGGADDYLPKPFNATELIVRVENLIALRRRLRKKYSQHMLGGIELPEPLPSLDAAFLRRVQEVIQENLSDTRFGVGQLAEAVGMSHRQLNRKMIGVCDTQARTLITRMRLERAAAMLAANSGSVKEIAYVVGFKSTSGFRDAFRAKYGVSPSAYDGSTA